MSELRRPLSRRLMLVMFALVVVPICGWAAVGVVLWRWSHGLDATDLARHSDMVAALRGALALVLVASFVAFGAAVLYLRRTVLDPLAELAARARAAASGPWQSPPARDRPDEIGDLARALDDSVTALHHRAEGAVLFAANLSHELRTPLAAITGAAELLGDDSIAREDRERFVANITLESERLARARATRAEPLLARKSLRIVVDVATDLPEAAIAAERMHRVLFGLLENAIKFSPAGASISLAATQVGDEIVVTVADEGPGVAPELREAIFDRYFSGPREGGPAARGTGLGLAIVKGLVEGACGRVRVDDAPSGGARFEVALPASTRSRSAALE
ncbi:MAG TPA: ATP-binding protein [Nannocystaceae bacterium]|nr:ATP-binding protein [Nannocystaceae bacterium]